ncbi:hypothetical protein GCM10027268_15500 [Brachybacterium huguangmaarense]
MPVVSMSAPGRSERSALLGAVGDVGEGEEGTDDTVASGVGSGRGARVREVGHILARRRTGVVAAGHGECASTAGMTAPFRRFAHSRRRRRAGVRSSVRQLLE